MDRPSENKILFSFYILGCRIAELCKSNILYYDFHDGNILFDKEGNCSILDLDDVEILEFPKEIEKYSNGIINLYTNFGMEYGAAFRYGLISVMGNIGQVLYDIMYNKHGLTVLENIDKPRQVNIENLNKMYMDWNSLVDNSFVKKVTNNSYQYYEFTFIELMQRNAIEFRKFKDTYKDNNKLMKHEYQTYLANAIRSENDFDIISASLTLCQLEFFSQDYFLAAYYYLLAREKTMNNEDFLMTLKDAMVYASALFVSKYGIEGSNRLFDYILHDTSKIRIQRGIIHNYFYEIWYWSDFAKEHLIDDFIVERLYGCYKCLDCNNMGFFDVEIKKCESCGSENLSKIPLLEYIALEKDRLMSLEDDISEESSEKATYITADIPELNSVSLIPMYIQIISSCQREKEFDTAIELARCVETFLKDHPEVCDKKGYVIERAREGGQIFYSPSTPNMLAKFFLNITENVRNDYESYILHKISTLYEEKGDIESALKYARKIINIANNSPRWIKQDYIVHACSIEQAYCAVNGNHKKELIFANMLFTYKMLDMIDNEYSNENINWEEKDTITNLVDIGETNANAENISLAYSCYMLALRMHIYRYGSRHPETAMIYSKLAQLLAIKKVYDEAYAFWGVSLLLLEKSKIERYNSQISEIETIILKCLSEVKYEGGLSDWKKEWMTDLAFNIFPEKRYEKNSSSENKIPKIEISKEDMLKDYIVHIP